jgi:NTP pyrophosphatase (non-canonical NTP hydrolase)
MISLEELQKKIIAFRDARDWKQFHTPKDLAIGLTLEAGEVAEHFLWKTDEQLKEYIQAHKEEIGDELGDVLYFLLLIANDFDINLLEAANKKIDKTELKYPVEKSKGKNVKYTNL